MSDRPATMADAAAILRWQQRAFSRNPAVPTLEEHTAWLRGRLDDENCDIRIIECGGVAAGVVRLECFQGKEISITIAKEYQRKGLARAALESLSGDIWAHVHPENKPSLALFRHFETGWRRR